MTATMMLTKKTLMSRCKMLKEARPFCPRTNSLIGFEGVGACEGDHRGSVKSYVFQKKQTEKNKQPLLQQGKQLETMFAR